MGAAYRAALTLAAAGLALACQRKPPAPLPDTDRPLEVLARPTLAGGTLDVSAYGGKVVAVNVWSPTCIPCAREAPGLQQVADELAPRGLALVTVMVDGTVPEAQAFVRRAGLTAPVVIGDSEIMTHLRVLAYPWTILLGRDGKPITAIRGSRDATQFRELFASAL